MTRGFLVVDKPRGITSNQVVGEVKRATGIKKIGHAGTLDPMATGVMVLAIGKVTRLIRYIQDQPKHHRKRSFDDEIRAILAKHGMTYSFG